MSFKTDFSKIDLRKYWFDEKNADAAVKYIETNIKHVSGPLSGEPFILEQWQKDEIIKPIFGWKYKKTGLRKYTEAYIEIPKKNGKTFVAAAIAAIFLDIEPENGVVPMFSIAGSEAQAKLTFDAASSIITQSRRLSTKCEIYKHAINVGEGHNRKYLQALASKSATQQGVNPQLVIADEVHIHQDSDLIDNQRKSMIAREQPLFLMITTAGDDIYGVGYDEHTRAIEVVQGKRNDEHLLVCVYCADKDDDPEAEATWANANPNYGVSVTKRGLMAEIEKAKHSQAKMNSFLRYHLNIWTNSVDSWIQDQVWQKCDWEITEDELLNYECKGGIDLSSTSDMSAFSLVFKTPRGYVSKNWYFLPQYKGKDSADKNNDHYVQWVADGDVIETPGRAIDYNYIEHIILEACRKYNVLSIGYDPAMAQQLVSNLDNEKIDMVLFRQGWITMTPAINEWERAMLDGEFNHRKDPVLRWMAGNVDIKTGPSMEKRFVKNPKRPEKKIDGMISNVIGIGLWVHPEEQKVTSYLEKTGGKIFWV